MTAMTITINDQIAIKSIMEYSESAMIRDQNRL
jgi:hypothetical protein